MTKHKEPMLLPINNELADQIILAFLRQHMAWAQDEIYRTTHSDDRAEATLDLAAMKRLYKYMTGEVL